jgi:5-methylcytosine-specific restriction endonuclease McrA
MKCPTCGEGGFSDVGVKSHHTQVHGESIVKTGDCAWCGDTVQVPPSDDGYERHFCDNDCQSSWRSENLRVDGFNSRNRVETECSWCGKVLSVKNYRFESQSEHFCDRSCMADFYSENNSGEENPNWGGGFSGHDGRLWQKRREQVMERDNRECQECGMSEQKHFEEYGCSLDAHHIVPARTFDSDEAAHELDNLMALCKVCHVEVEQQT